METSIEVYRDLLGKVTELAATKYADLPKQRVHPSRQTLQDAETALYTSLPEEGKDVSVTINHLLADICPALADSSATRYFGFVTGGTTPAAQLADFLTTIHDQNVQVHLPQCSVSTTVEDAALRMTIQLLSLNPADWPGRTLTTGATASNLLGLACGRNSVLRRVGIDVGEDGFAGAKVQIFCVSAHASIKKTASIIGIGRANCIEVADPVDFYKVAFDLEALEVLLKQNQQNRVGSIVQATIGEVNTGLSTPHMAELRALCDRYGAWLHIDAAFAVFAGVYPPLSRMLADLKLADSICVDGHKWLNVPYDCAMFFTRELGILKNVCASGPAAYLTSSIGTSTMTIESPLNVGIENSRRFRALPLYATLVAYGRAGYAELFKRNIEFARSIDAWLRQSEYFEVLTPLPADRIGALQSQNKYETTNIVLFTLRADKMALSGFKDMTDVIAALNDTGNLYVTGTVFNGHSAARLAVSNWRTGLAKTVDHEGSDEQDISDLEVVLSTLRSLLPRSKHTV